VWVALDKSVVQLSHRAAPTTRAPGISGSKMTSIPILLAGGGQGRTPYRWCGLSGGTTEVVQACSEACPVEWWFSLDQPRLVI
jgi:hypothetical protein